MVMFKSKILPMLLSVAIAFGLWAYVITFVSSEREGTFSDIAVSYQGEALLEERGLMIVTEEKPTVTLTLYGNRRELNKLDNSNIAIIADLSKIGEPGIHNLRYNVYYPGDIPDNTFTVQSQYPGMVKIEVERRITKEIPVNVTYKGSVKKDYIADKEKVELDNSNVIITGPASAVNQITQAIVQVDLQDKSESFMESYRFTLCDAAGEPVDAKMVETNIAEVGLTLYIKRVKEVELVVTVVDGGGATKATSDISIDPRTIKIAGNETALKDIDEINLGTINLGELTKDSEKTFEIKLPDGLDNLSGKTTAKVTVKFPKLETVSFAITDFAELNVPEGMEVEFITEELTVNLRGPKELIRRITVKDVSATVDFTDAETGNATFKANIVIGKGFKGVGAMGNYTVSATLKKIGEKDK